MLAIGLDYGTTNSIITVFQEDVYSPNVAKILIPSSITDGNRFVASPKRLLCNIRTCDRDAISKYIQMCVNKLFEELTRKYSNLEFKDIHLTITVPNAFKDEQCLLMKSVISQTTNAYFPNSISQENIHIIPEPIAAALYYAYCKGRNLPDKQYAIVSDIGGGTTDLAVVRIERKFGNNLTFKVLCTEHDALLGGDDIDAAIADHISQKQRIDNNNDLKRAGRAMKEFLSYQDICLLTLLDKNGNPYIKSGNEIEISLERNRLNNIIQNSVIESGETFEYRFKKKLKDLSGILQERFINTGKNGEGYEVSEVEDVLKHKTIILPVGGSSRIPLIQSYIKDVFPSTEIFTLKTEDDYPNSKDDKSKFDSISRGAAVYSAFSCGLLQDVCKRINIENRTPHKISVKYLEDRVHTCVDKNMPDGEYTTEFIPKAFLPDGNSFSLNVIELYQGGNNHSNVIDDDTVELERFELPDIISAPGKKLNEILIYLRVKIKNGRILKITIDVPVSNYSKVIDF